MVTPLDPNPALAEAERAELERVVEALSRWPRLSQLLRYMGKKLSSGEIDDLNEYNIATEVLGRSKTVFNAGEDAIGRVETHRLRKRLAEFYETDGKDHPIQVTLPAQHRSESESRGRVERLSRWRFLRWKYRASAAFLVVIGSGLYLYLRSGTQLGHATRESSPIAAPDTAPLQPGASSSPIPIIGGLHWPAENGQRVENMDCRSVLHRWR